MEISSIGENIKKKMQIDKNITAGFYFIKIIM